MAHSLNSKQINEFFSRGWTVAPNLFDSSEIQRMREAFDRLEVMAEYIKTPQLYKGSSFVLGEKNGKTIIHRIVWCGAAEPVLSEFGKDPRLVNMAAQLLGSRTMQQLINQAHFKLPGDGVVFDWHQDIQHRQKNADDWRDLNGRGSYVQTILTLDDMTLENGPLLLIPESHKQGRIDLGGDSYAGATKKVDPPNAKKAEMAVLAAGGVLLFGPYTIHGSFENQSSRSRRVLINGFAYPGANSRAYPGEGSGRILTCEESLQVDLLP